MSSSGIITTVAGNPSGPYFQSSSSTSSVAVATGASINEPLGVAVDNAGNLFVTVFDPGLLKVSTSGLLSGIAGREAFGTNGSPLGVAVDGIGNVFFADQNNNVVKKISPGGTITTVAGNGVSGYSGDGGPATSASLNRPYGIAVDGSGNLFIVDAQNSSVRKVAANGGIITTIFSSVPLGVSGLYSGVAIDTSANVFLMVGNSLVRVAPSGGTTILAALSNVSGDGLQATSAQLLGVNGIAVDDSGAFFIGDQGLKKISPNGIITSVPGTVSRRPTGTQSIAVDVIGNVVFGSGTAVSKLLPNGTITTIAGNGQQDFAGDGGLAVSAAFRQTDSVTVASDGSIFVSDVQTNRVRKISQTGIITTVAGSGPALNGGGFSGDNGLGTNALLNAPLGIAVDSAGNLFIADYRNNRVRKVSTTGVITTVAGNGVPGLSGDGGRAVDAQLSGPAGLAIDSSNNIFISDCGNNRIRKVSSDGTITTIAGTLIGYSGDGGPAATAQLDCPRAITIDGTGNIYVVDNEAVRLLRPSNQAILVGAILDAASESTAPLAPGKIVVIYGTGLGPATLVPNQVASGGVFSTQAGGTAVFFNGIAAPIIYSSATQVAAVVPYGISGSPTAQVTVRYQGQQSSTFTVPVAPSAPSFFSLYGTGAGQIAAINLDGSVNDAAHPVKVGSYISLYATGEGQTNPLGVDGKLASGTPYPAPILPVKVTVGGVLATVTYAGAAPTSIAGLMQIVVQIPAGLNSGGYVPVILQVGTSSSVDGAAWIAVSGN